MPVDCGFGYGRMGHYIKSGLEARGYDTHQIDPGKTAPVPPVALFVTTPTHVKGWWEGQHSVIFTMWETTLIPPTFAESLNAFDLVLVPSHFNLELFGRYHGNVKRVPLGIDPDIWDHRERSDPDPFVFFTAGFGSRKGNDLSLKAFQRVRDEIVARGQRPPRLVMRSKWKVDPDPDIAVINYHVSDDEEVELYSRAHCYLGPSRGEGWGLMPLQAIAQGCPTILTDAHGHADFAHLGIGIPAGHSKADYQIWGDVGNWWEPDLDALADRMLWVHDHFDQAKTQAKDNAPLAAQMSWDATVEALVEAIGPVMNAAPVEAQTWTVPEHDLYRIVVNKNLDCEIGGIGYHFVTGAETFEPADVKRILFEAGYLDPVCITEHDSGLSESRVNARANHCPTCGQALTCPT